MMKRQPLGMLVGDECPPPIVAAASGGVPPFDVADFRMDDSEIERAVEAGGIRFASLAEAFVTVELADGWVFHHRLDFVDGVLVSHRGWLAPPGSPSPSSLGKGVHVGLNWDYYIRFRSREVGIAEACAASGFLHGEFPLLALGEGLVDGIAFEERFPRWASSDLVPW